MREPRFHHCAGNRAVVRTTLAGRYTRAAAVFCVLFILHGVSVWAAEATAGSSSDTCASCHQVSAHTEDWERSVHIRSGLTCSSCHVRKQGDKSSAPSLPSDRPASCLDAHQNVVVMCGRCHQNVAQAFRQSAHFRRADSGPTTPVCTDCHSAAGGSVLSGDLVPQRCATCHSASGAAGAAWVTEKAPELLRLLRRVTLARSMDTELLHSVRSRGTDTTELETDLERVDTIFRDLPSEWHRFNLYDVEARSRHALEILESLHDRLEDRYARSVTAPSPAATPGVAAEPDRPLRFAAASIVNPVATFEEYRGLFDDLARVLGRPHEFIQRRTYHEINDLLLRGEVDLAFVCSGGYAALPSNGPIDLIAVPVVNGRSVNHSLIIVRKASPIRRFEDLHGSRFAFTDPLSTGGHFYPLFRLAQLGEDPRQFFTSTLFSGSHDQSILAVYHGLVDAAAVNERVYNRLVTPNSAYFEQLRVIESSPDFGNPPVVAPTSVPADLRARMREFLLHLADTPQGRERLAALGFDGFIVGKKELYESIREIHGVTGVKSR